MECEKAVVSRQQDQEAIRTVVDARHKAELHYAIELASQDRLNKETQEQAQKAKEAIETQLIKKQQAYAQFFRHILAITLEAEERRRLLGDVETSRFKHYELQALWQKRSTESIEQKRIRDELFFNLRASEDKNLALVHVRESEVESLKRQLSELSNVIKGKERDLKTTLEKIVLVRKESACCSAMREANYKAQMEGPGGVLALQSEYDSIYVQNVELELLSQRRMQDLTRLQMKYSTMEADVHNSLEESRQESEIREKDGAIARSMFQIEKLQEELEFISLAKKDTESGIENGHTRVRAMQQEASFVGQNRNNLRCYVQSRVQPPLKSPKSAQKSPRSLQQTESIRERSVQMLTPSRSVQLTVGLSLSPQLTPSRSARKSEFVEEFHRKGLTLKKSV